MRILVIDSHKGTDTETPTNLHWRNAKQIADYLGADLIWSYPSVNNQINEDYDRIIFVHASPYCAVDKAWLERSPDAELFYVTNEYNLGEPTILWKPAKSGRHYTVIANHEPDISKVVLSYVKTWHKINLNALVYDPDIDCSGYRSNKCVYFGSFRKGRIPSYQKYLTGQVVISTSPKNVDKFKEIGVKGAFVNRLSWKHKGLCLFESSLYIEDEVTHRSYNYLANRFYEALSYNVPTLFSRECIDTIRKSGYEVPREFIITDDNIPSVKDEQLPFEWFDKAIWEKDDTLEQIKEIVT